MNLYSQISLGDNELDVGYALALCTEDVVFIGSGAGEHAVGRQAVVDMKMSLGEQSTPSHRLGK